MKLKVAATDRFCPPCRKCCGQNGVHYLTCPVLDLPPGWAQAEDEQRREIIPLP